jgi:hypothetical protein
MFTVPNGFYLNIENYLIFMGVASLMYQDVSILDIFYRINEYFKGRYDEGDNIFGTILIVGMDFYLGTVICAAL